METIVIDLDGVLTDGKQYITGDGKKLFKAFHSRDVAAIRELIFNGYRVVICTADSDPSGKHFASKVGAEYLNLRDKSKLPFKDFICVGDSAWDIPMMQQAKSFYCPSDADISVMCLPGVRVLATKGGQGVLSELARIILKHEETYSYDHIEQ